MKQVSVPHKRRSAIVTLLLVSRNPRHLEVLGDLSREEEGYRILAATSEEEALRLLADEEVRVLLLDLGSSGWNAFELCRAARRRDPGSAVQILLIFGAGGQWDPEALLESGADDFVVEPVTARELRLRLRAVRLRREQSRPSLRRRSPRAAAGGREARRSTPAAGEGESAAGRRPRAGSRYETESPASRQQENLRLRERVEQLRGRNAELERENQELQKLASVDALTGLYNRRSLFHRMEMEIDRTLRFNLFLCGILMDIDNFKAINDGFGHSCGDQVLREIGEKLVRNLRKYDFAGRYGGEEFFIILPNTQARTGLRIAERFRSELDKTPFLCGGSPVQITLSLGVAQFQPGETREQWVNRADAALYRAKQEGRNRVFLG